VKKRNLLSLIITSAIVTAYGFTEGSWFNSYVSQILGMDKIWVSVMVATSGFMGAIFFIVWGTISDNNRDRFGRRKSVLVSGIVITGILVIIFGFSRNYIACLILDGVLIGISSNMFHSTRKALVPDLSKMRERGKVNSNIMIFGGIGGIFTYLFVIWGQRDIDGNYTELTHIIVITLTGILLLIGAVAVFLTLDEPMDNLPPTRNWWQDIKNIFDWKEFKKHKDFYRFFIAYLLPIMARYAYFPFLLLYVQEMGLSATETLFYSLTMGVGTLLGPVIFTRISDKLGRKRVILITLPCAVLGFLLLAFSQYNIWILYFGMFIMSFFLEGHNYTSETWSQDLVDEDSRGRFLGIVNIAMSAGQIPGVILSGLFADLLGIWVVFVIAAIFVVIAIPLYLRVPDYITQKPSPDRLPSP
jgi:MFS family permease